MFNAGVFSAGTGLQGMRVHFYRGLIGRGQTKPYCVRRLDVVLCSLTLL